MQAEDLLMKGKGALVRGDWGTARRALEQAAVQAPTGETLEALGSACWWQDDGKAVLEVREAAYRLYREEGDLRSAARLATLVGVDYWDYRGDSAVASGWLRRAESLLSDLDVSLEHGWLHVYQGYVSLMYDNDIEEARRRLDLLSDLGPSIGSIDVEMMAVALRGLASIREGAISEGMRSLDEAMMAAVGGDMSDLPAIGNTCCSLIYACEAVADYDRAAQWCERTREFCKRLGMDMFFAICRNYYATLLIWRGAWEEADMELTAAMLELQTNRPSYAMESLAKLGELRRRQGRIEEATGLFGQAEPHHTAVFGQAAIALDRGDVETATDLLQRLLRRVGEEDQAERVFILELLSRTYLADGDSNAAEAVLGEMSEVARQIGTTPLAATVLATRSAIAMSNGKAEEARRGFEDAIDLFLTTEAAFEAARVRLELAGALKRLGRHEPAVQQAMLARTTFSQLGASLYREKASQIVSDLSNKFGAPPPEARLPHGITAREGDVLWLIAAGRTNQEIAEELVLSVRTVERHISTIYEKLGVTGRAARASAASIAVVLRANTHSVAG